MTWEAVIGLEVHAHLSTATKIFCACSTAFGAPPNTHVCPVCLGFPGALPVLNRRAVELAIRAAVATDCTIHERSVFARKNYFYPDLPKGYQISQFDRPLATGGRIGNVRILRIHMEEDAGKSIHHGDVSHVDLNRAGTPLVEIVSEPDIRSAEEADVYLTRLRQILMYTNVCDGNMEEGSLRCDANVSVRRHGAQLGTRAEIKNLNSFRYLRSAIDFEIARQTAILESGRTITQETRLYDPAAGETRTMRSKEEAHDYRYFPEPDLPPVNVAADRLERIRAAMPELPEARRRRFVGAFGLPEYDAGQLTQSRGIADYFEAAVAAGAPAKAASNWIMGELARVLKEHGADIAASPVDAARLAGLIALVEKGTISGSMAKGVFEKMYASGRTAEAIVAAEGLAQIDDEPQIVALIAEVLAANAGPVADFRGGKASAFGFLVGKVMKAAGGKANPKRVNELLQKALGSG
jgi:aspartyl-tRNA(Asn)/glutamyl-tRNA(Gln) amidotransferase subunit B